MVIFVTDSMMSSLLCALSGEEKKKRKGMVEDEREVKNEKGVEGCARARASAHRWSTCAHFDTRVCDATLGVVAICAHARVSRTDDEDRREGVVWRACVPSPTKSRRSERIFILGGGTLTGKENKKKKKKHSRVEEVVAEGGGQLFAHGGLSGAHHAHEEEAGAVQHLRRLDASLLGAGSA